MKKLITIFSAATLLGSCHQPLKESDFVSERITKSATIILNGPPDQVFPLFGAFEERKWSEGWQPILIYPETETIQEGTTFATQGHGEKKFTWIITRYDHRQYLIQYLVYTENRHWTITITCSAHDENKTKATITYDFTGHNSFGNEINQVMLLKMYANELRDWEEEINRYRSQEPGAGARHSVVSSQ
ncbi:SRPBCC family protein [Chryseolinea soli]|uniref:SRPBCC family protein n=1 Tax=Chryseolinea soli TaxID=2321403 RepID=A0A385SPB8_9BACT|nr:SRPBCC family protein [Chryseolinea soli]AYB33019.1 SRPBCC family protein [Chryseolinea soli]